jgi:hypothetical protein
MQIDLYIGTRDRALRMAVAHGTGLPDHVDLKDWEPLGIDRFEGAVLDGDVVADIEERAFYFYKLVES